MADQRQATPSIVHSASLCEAMQSNAKPSNARQRNAMQEVLVVWGRNAEGPRSAGCGLEREGRVGEARGPTCRLAAPLGGAARRATQPGRISPLCRCLLTDSPKGARSANCATNARVRAW
eukprot:9499889-Pyramimonas_sp.AAC.1